MRLSVVPRLRDLFLMLRKEAEMKVCLSVISRDHRLPVGPSGSIVFPTFHFLRPFTSRAPRSRSYFCKQISSFKLGRRNIERMKNCKSEGVNCLSLCSAFEKVKVSSRNKWEIINKFLSQTFHPLWDQEESQIWWRKFLALQSGISRGWPYLLCLR